MKYFAYGTNINLAQMDKRCPYAKVLGKAKLEGFELFFTKRGVPSIRAKTEKVVWGILWEIGENCEKSLDSYEGFPELYRKETVFVAKNSLDIETFTYIANENEEGKPGHYLATLLLGAKDNKLPQQYIEDLENKYGPID